MRTSLIVLALALTLAAACGDDDTETPDAGGYYGGVKDTTIVLQDSRAEVQTGPTGDEVTLAPRYRAEAEAFRAYADALSELEPPEIGADDHDALVAASYAIAEDLEELADLVEEEPRGTDIITAEQEVQQRLSDNAFTWNTTCIAIDLKTQEDIPCNVAVAQE